MRALIVGCGYVGTAAGAELVRQGHQVWGLRRRHDADVQLQSAGITPVTADITEPETLAGLPAQWDWVVHCPSATGGGPEQYQRVYVEGTRNVLAWLAATPPRKLVYTSSTSVYAQADGSLVDEESPTAPIAGTARLLLEAERLLLDAARYRQFTSVILRVAGIYGPGRGYWLKQFLSGEAQIEGGGGRFLNMVHRDDVAGAIVTALSNARPGEIYNVVDDEPVTQLGCFEWLSQRLGRPLPPSAPQPETRRRGDSNKRVSNQKLKTELGYRLKYATFRKGYARELDAKDKLPPAGSSSSR